jgi:hypothetical protein
MFATRNDQSTIHNKATVEPIVRLWILRLLVPLEGHRTFISKHGLDSEEIAGWFDLQTGADEDNTQFNANQALRQLKRCYDPKKIS